MLFYIDEEYFSNIYQHIQVLRYVRCLKSVAINVIGYRFNSPVNLDNSAISDVYLQCIYHWTKKRV